MLEFWLEILRGKDGLLSSRRLIALWVFAHLSFVLFYTLKWLMAIGQYKEVTEIVLAFLILLGGSGYYIAKEKFKK